MQMTPESEPQSGPSGLTRRAGIVGGAKLAFAAPAVLAALRGGVAFADTGTKGTKGTKGTDTVTAADVTATDTATDTGTGTATTDTTTTNTTTKVDGVETEVVVLASARLCEVVDGSVEHKKVGAFRLLTDGSSNFLHFHLKHAKHAGSQNLTITASPSNVLNGKVVALARGRGTVSGITNEQRAQLVVSETKRFVSGTDGASLFQFALADGSTTRTFVICPSKH